MLRAYLVLVALGLGVGVNAQTDAPVLTAAPPAPTAADRIAKTPRIDGQLSSDEWAELWVNEASTAYQQWEEGTLYLAVRYPKGKAILISIDGANDGWLKGASNAEIILSTDSAPPHIRLLDNTGQLPIWRESPLLKAGLVSALGTEGENVVAELALTAVPADGLSWDNGRTLGLRVDMVDADKADRPAYEPRVLAPIRLVYDTMELPPHVKWKVDWADRLVAPGDRLDLTFEVKNDGVELFPASGLAITGDAVSREWLSSLDARLEPLVPKATAKVEYKSSLGKATPTGVYALQLTLYTADGKRFTGQSSFTVGDSVRLVFKLPSQRVKLDKSNRFNGEVFVEAHTQKGQSGNLVIVAPPGWRIVKGESRSFHFRRTRMRMRLPFEMEAPAGTAGVFKLKAQASLRDTAVAKEVWLEVLPAPDSR